MSRTRAIVFIAVLATGCSSGPPERQVIDDAAAALGGASRIQALTSLHITGSGSAPNAGQNRMPDDELPVWKVTEHTRTIDLANGRTRVRQLREAQFQFAGATVQRQYAGARRRRRVQRRTRRHDERARARRPRAIAESNYCITRSPSCGPRWIPAPSSPTLRTEGSEQLVDITTASGDAVTLAIDRSTQLPRG